VGSFNIGKAADEKILHGILNFGRSHPKARIRVQVEDLNMDGTLPGFMTLAYLILQAIRGQQRSDFVVRKDNKMIPF
jgi:hypothetical protein